VQGSDTAEETTCGGAGPLLDVAATTVLVELVPLVPFCLLELPFLSAFLCTRLLG